MMLRTVQLLVCPLCRSRDYAQTSLEAHLWSSHRSLAILVETVVALARRLLKLEDENRVLRMLVQELTRK